ncbi:hypothetical protein BABINDRAFT_36621 [Babjeviella inositovora NRRL Y-12698]|uniref:Type 2A phosphatase activator TIP41 n=1 Tax=Babjeviella inositovora NRRL Y-12698 TaxID=984486 RepID=A0A1E3QQR8_9ASCO|nr:uncharacterized protein BABINDRAFT_36621 [Babjeviella inositovora NRRL Y-12698]ODQ80000.1 hypothetical protein BABINDRAFT_36621 [Babjeviella inositovora NRRL Y-12698]
MSDQQNPSLTASKLRYPRRPTEGPGINAVHINRAREMAAVTANARLPSHMQSRGQTARPETTHSFTPPRAVKVPVSLGSIAGSRVSIPGPIHPSGCQNPQCADCGSIIIPAPRSSFPVQDSPVIKVNNWCIYSLKKPILNAQEIEAMEERLDFPVPEMIFGNNHIFIKHEAEGKSWEISFNCYDAIKDCDTISNLKVSYHKEWSSYRSNEKSEVPSFTSQLLKQASPSPSPSGETLQLSAVKPYDWTYSTKYKGTVGGQGPQFSRNQEAEIPISKLTRPDPILYFDEMVLYEDELADNGISIVSLKIRVMPTCLLLLQRFYLRIDQVIFRIRDTRVYIDLNTNEVIREYKEQELLYDEVMRMAKNDFKSAGDPGKLLRDPNWCSQMLPVLRTEREYLKI